MYLKEEWRRAWQREQARLTWQKIMHLSKCQTGDSFRRQKRHGFCLDSHILKRKGKGRERKGWEGEKGKER